MTARTHDLAAITALGVVVFIMPFRTLTLATVLVVILANQLGGIVPDIDQPTAPLWRNLPIGRFFGKLVGESLGGHRFLTHSIVGMAIFGFLGHALLIFLSPIMHHVDTGYVWWAFMIGMLSHLIMDSFTKEGVPWLLPLPMKFGFPPLKAFRVTTGKVLETSVIFPGLLLLDIIFCATHYQFLLTLVHRYIV